MNNLFDDNIRANYEQLLDIERKSNPFRYGLCWEFIELTARKNPKTISMDEAIITLDLRSRRKAYAFLPLGRGLGTILPQLEMELQRLEIECCYLSKLRQTDVRALLERYEYGPPLRVNLDIPFSEIPDDIYPQVVVNAAHVAALSGPRLRRPRYRCGWFFRRYGSRTTSIQYTPELRRDAESLLEKWISNWCERHTLSWQEHSKDATDFLRDPYLHLLDLLDGELTVPTIARLIYINGEPGGFFTLFQTSPICYSQVASIALTKWPGLSEFIMAQAAGLISDDNDSYINLGGSETKGLFRFKLKFNPEHFVTEVCFAFFPAIGCIRQVK